MPPTGPVVQREVSPPSSLRRSTHRVALAALVVYWAAIFIATHLPGHSLPDLKVGDKTEHFIAYGILAALLFVVLRLRGQNALRAAGLTVVIVAVYGAIDEWTQPLVGRTCDRRDWIADATAAILAVAICLLATRVARSGISDVKSEIPDLRSEISDPRSEIPDLRSEIPDVRSEIPNVRSEISDPKSRIPKPKAP